MDNEFSFLRTYKHMLKAAKGTAAYPHVVTLLKQWIWVRTKILPLLDRQNAELYRMAKENAARPNYLVMLEGDGFGQLLKATTNHLQAEDFITDYIRDNRLDYYRRSKSFWNVWASLDNSKRIGIFKIPS